MRSRAAITGIGTTDFGAFPGETAHSLALRAANRALGDAGLERGDVDGLIVVRVPDYQHFAQAFGIDPDVAFVLQAQGRMCGVAMNLAASLVASGSARHVVVAYGNDGRSNGAKYGGLADRYSGESAADWFPYGMTSPGALHAMLFAAHAHRYGTSPLALAEVAVAFREHAALNPAAVMRKPITVDDHQRSRFIVEPLRLLDYCQINDGGVAVIVSSADVARDRPHPPVWIRAVACGTRLSKSLFPMDDFWHAPMRRVADSVYRTSGLGPSDMDALMIYDNFTPTVLFTLEGFGYCPPGESGPWVSEGHLRLGGRYPTNTSGGHLSESYMQGWALVAEGVRQVRGTAGERQVTGAHNVHYMCATSVCSSIVLSGSP